MRFWSVAGTGLAMCGAWRSVEASTALIARWRSKSGGAMLALVGMKPSRATPRPPRIRTARVTTTPRRKLRMKPPAYVPELLCNATPRLVHHAGEIQIRWHCLRNDHDKRDRRGRKPRLFRGHVPEILPGLPGSTWRRQYASNFRASRTT